MMEWTTRESQAPRGRHADDHYCDPPPALSVSLRTARANGIEFHLLQPGTRPLAPCLHGFPDTANTWRYLLPALADAGFRAVAPFMRGYAPTSIPTDGCFELGALVADAVALHDGLGADESAVLVGRDWGA